MDALPVCVLSMNAFSRRVPPGKWNWDSSWPVIPQRCALQKHPTRVTKRYYLWNNLHSSWWKYFPYVSNVERQNVLWKYIFKALDLNVILNAADVLSFLVKSQKWFFVLPGRDVRRGSSSVWWWCLLSVSPGAGETARKPVTQHVLPSGC